MKERGDMRIDVDKWETDREIQCTACTAALYCVGLNCPKQKEKENKIAIGDQNTSSKFQSCLCVSLTVETKRLFSSCHNHIFIILSLSNVHHKPYRNVSIFLPVTKLCCSFFTE